MPRGRPPLRHPAPRRPSARRGDRVARRPLRAAVADRRARRAGRGDAVAGRRLRVPRRNRCASQQCRFGRRRAGRCSVRAVQPRVAGRECRRRMVRGCALARHLSADRPMLRPSLRPVVALITRRRRSRSVRQSRGTTDACLGGDLPAAFAGAASRRGRFSRRKPRRIRRRRSCRRHFPNRLVRHGGGHRGDGTDRGRRRRRAYARHRRSPGHERPARSRSGRSRRDRAIRRGRADAAQYRHRQWRCPRPTHIQRRQPQVPLRHRQRRGRHARHVGASRDDGRMVGVGAAGGAPRNARAHSGRAHRPHRSRRSRRPCADAELPLGAVRLRQMPTSRPVRAAWKERSPAAPAAAIVIASSKRSSRSAMSSGTGAHEATVPRGVILLVAMVAVVGMAFAGIALLRAVATGVAIGSNVDARRAATFAASAALEHDVVVLFDDAAIDTTSDDPAHNYFASRQAGEDRRGVPAALLSDADYPPEPGDRRRRRGRRAPRHRASVPRARAGDARQLHVVAAEHRCGARLAVGNRGASPARLSGHDTGRCAGRRRHVRAGGALPTHRTTRGVPGGSSTNRRRLAMDPSARRAYPISGM